MKRTPGRPLRSKEILTKYCTIKTAMMLFEKPAKTPCAGWKRLAAAPRRIMAAAAVSDAGLFVVRYGLPWNPGYRPAMNALGRASNGLPEPLRAAVHGGEPLEMGLHAATSALVVGGVAEALPGIRRKMGMKNTEMTRRDVNAATAVALGIGSAKEGFDLWNCIRTGNPVARTAAASSAPDIASNVAAALMMRRLLLEHVARRA